MHRGGASLAFEIVWVGKGFKQLFACYHVDDKDPDSESVLCY